MRFLFQNWVMFPPWAGWYLRRRNRQETCRLIAVSTNTDKSGGYILSRVVRPPLTGRKLTNFVSWSRAVWGHRGRRAARASGACIGIDGKRGRAAPPREPAASPSVRARG